MSYQSYHYAFKKILGIPKYFSNHFICDIFSALTYEHFINFKCIRFLFYKGAIFIFYFIKEPFIKEPKFGAIKRGAINREQFVKYLDRHRIKFFGTKIQNFDLKILLTAQYPKNNSNYNLKLYRGRT